jgi:hypothetical protein
MAEWQLLREPRVVTNALELLMKMITAVFMSFMVAVLAVRFGLSHDSEDPPVSPTRHEIAAKLETLATGLQLDAVQKKKILPILQQEAPQVQAVKNSRFLSPLEKAVQLKQISTSSDERVQPLLNPQQWQKWHEVRSEENRQLTRKLESQH